MDVVALRLYLAGNGPNSTMARANLRRLLAEVDPARYSLEIVDCLRDPLSALEQGVLVTPTLVRVSPQPRVTIIGTLRDAAAVADAIGLELTARALEAASIVTTYRHDDGAH